jgi:RNA methyltransferase, TrmH family
VAEARHVSSRDNPLLVRVRKLGADPGAYRKLGELWLEGDHLCAAFAQRGGRALQAVVSTIGWEQPALRALAIVPPDLMAGLSALESPPAIGFVVTVPTAPALAPELPTVILDRLQDAGNVGAILRSASAFGFTQVVAIKGTAALWSPKVLRAGMGAHFALRLVDGIEMEALAALQLPLLATSSHAERALHEVTLPWPCAWVLGHEGRGISAALLARCAASLRITQPGGEESLNVAAAAAVCLYESARQRAK